MKAKAGDWIKFLCDSSLVIDEVSLVLERWECEHYITLHHAAVSQDRVLEVRSAPEKR